MQGTLLEDLSVFCCYRWYKFTIKLLHNSTKRAHYCISVVIISVFLHFWQLHAAQQTMTVFTHCCVSMALVVMQMHNIVNLWGHWPSCFIYKSVSKSFETSSVDRQPMAVREWVRCAWEQGTLPLSIPSGVAVWTLGVAQHECLSPRVSSHLRFQHGRETGAESKHQILPETRQIWSGDFWNDTMCV